MRLLRNPRLDMQLLRNLRLDMRLLPSRRSIRPRRQSKKSKPLQQRFSMLPLHNPRSDMRLLPSRSLTRPRRRLHKNRVVKSLRPQKPSLLQPIRGRQSSVPTAGGKSRIEATGQSPKFF
jgi:hypothetical protein